MLQDLNIDDFKSKSPDYTCESSPFIYNPAGYVITGDLNIINNTSLPDCFTKGQKCRELKSTNWRHNFKIIIIITDSVYDYAGLCKT